MKLRYSSNNSGGSWWLSDEDWKALEKAGWDVQWCKKDSHLGMVNEGRFLGALATDASIEVENKADALTEIERWSSVTGQSPRSLGCSCCGPPHSFVLMDGGRSVEYWSPSYPEEGEW